MALIDIVIVVVKSGICYTFFMMIPVYINLNILKKSTIDHEGVRLLKYVPYVLGVLLNALFFAWIFKKVGHNLSNFLQHSLPLLLNALIIFGVQLISTGLIFKRENILSRRRFSREIRKLKKQIEASLYKPKDVMDSTNFSANKKVITLGNRSATKMRFIPIKDILFLEACGNGCFFYYKNNQGIHRVESSNSLTKHREQGFLPEEMFTRIHRSFIVANHQVIGRNGNRLTLNAPDKFVERTSKIGKLNIVKELEIPIGANFEGQIDLENWLEP